MDTPEPDAMPPDPFGTPDADQVFLDITTPEQRLDLLRGRPIEVTMTREQARILDEDPIRAALRTATAYVGRALDEDLGSVCLSCDGCGYDDGAGETCFSCGGSGWIDA